MELLKFSFCLQMKLKLLKKISSSPTHPNKSSSNLKSRIFVCLLDFLFFFNKKHNREISSLFSFIVTEGRRNRVGVFKLFKPPLKTAKGWKLPYFLSKSQLSTQPEPAVTVVTDNRLC